MAKIFMSGGFEGPGERLTAQHMAAHLPSHWVAVFNKEVPRQNSSREVDAIVVGDNGVFAIEEKHWPGPIKGDESRWVLGWGETRRSPLNQAKQASQFVQSFLDREIPGFAQLFQGTNFKAVESFVLMSAECEIDVNDPRADRWVVKLGASEAALLAEDHRHLPCSIAGLRDAIVLRLTTLKDQPRIPTRVNAYEIVEIEREGKWVDSLRARHDNGEERILRLVRKPDELDQGPSEEVREALLREHKALSQLKDTGVVPRVYDWFDWGDGQAWIIPMDPPHGQSLAASAIEDQPSESLVRQIVPPAFDALATLHGAGIIHRGITPDRVFIDEGMVSFFDLLVARIPRLDATVAQMVDELDPGNTYRAPECAPDPSLASPASDVYSLAASLLSWATDLSPGEPEWPPDLAGHRRDLPRPFVDSLGEALHKGLDADRSARPSAADMRDSLAQICNSIITARHPEGARLDNDRYKVIRELGHGATAVTYLAEDKVRSVQVVLKQIMNPELIPLALAEYETLRRLQHPNLVSVIEVYPADHDFHLKLEYVPGLSLADDISRFRNQVDRTVDLGLQLTDALTYLREQNQIHRDISPKNIMVPDDESAKVKVIDFALSRQSSESTSAVGTPRYRAPEIDTGGPWSSGCDLYSVATILFEMLTGRLPYELEEGIYPRKDRLVELGALDLSDSELSVTRVLATQVSPHPNDRYAGIEEFARALRAAATGVLEQKHSIPGDELVNPWVDEIRGLYRNSRIGNSDNRGLDSGFARDTYVPTGLDERLLPALLAGDVRFLILSGNPGDGKTAFLRRVLEAARLGGAQDIDEDEAGWRARLEEHRFAAVYDASESHGDLSADDLVHASLVPLAGDAPGDDGFTAMLAVNDGRLIDFFERFGSTEYPWLWERVQPQLMQHESMRDGVVLVDLKRRALSGGTGLALFERLLQPLVAPERWAICGGCSARQECPILFNATSLGPSAPGVRARLGEMLMAVHLRRERRPTIRDMRSALAYLITQDLSCSEIHDERNGKQLPLSLPGRPYFNAFFSGEGGPDLLLDQWRLLDPAAVASASLDRFLHFHRERSGFLKVENLFEPISDRARGPSVGLDEEAWFTATKRRYLFEGSPGTEELLPDPDALLAYRHLASFVDSLAGSSDDVELLQRLLTAIGCADRVPLSSASPGLSLRTREGEDEDDEVVIIKRFPIEEFRLVRPAAKEPFIELVPDQLAIAHRDGYPKLGVGLDLFEFLSRTADGLVAGADEHRPLLEDLATFKHQLLARSTERVSISVGGHRVHEIVALDGTLTVGRLS